MRRLIVSAWMTLDGVVQAPIGPDEDRDGGFRHGGWHRPHTVDPVFQRRMTASIAGAGAYVFGRRTYEEFAAFWPNAPEAEQAVARPLNERPKYVASRTLAAPLPWAHATLLPGDAVAGVDALKRESGGDLLVFGSTQLVGALAAHDLIDEYRLVIDPVLAGGGKRIFRDDGALRTLRLVDHEVTGSGAILATYVPADR